LINSHILDGNSTKIAASLFFGGTFASNDKILSITVWESEEEMLASEAGAGYLQAEVAKFNIVFANPPTFDHYELSAEAWV
jgi:hypothetical protein